MSTRVLQLSRRGSVRTLQGLCVVALATGLSGCMREPVAEEPATVNESMAPTGDAAMAPTAPAELVRAAIDDAAQRTSTRVADVVVVSAESVTWPDGSLGCPQPGMNYTMALVPGYRMLVQAGGQVLRYHAGTLGTVKFCPEGQAVDPVGGNAAI